MKKKFRVIAMLNGVPQGYIKSVSYTRGTFSLTRTKSQAKNYATDFAVQKEIDFLTGVAFQMGYVFIYE